jgi:GNAT superfamily N-acetyltransferase
MEVAVVPPVDSLPLAAEWSRDGFTVSCDPAKLDHRVVHDFLAASYWAKDIPIEIVQRSIEGSLCFALLAGDRQVGFARVITDRATIAYLGDVFVLPGYRGKGLGKWLVECVLAHPQLQGLRRWVLVTADAHGLYQQFGFKPLARPQGFMEIHQPQLYSRE